MTNEQLENANCLQKRINELTREAYKWKTATRIDGLTLHNDGIYGRTVNSLYLDDIFKTVRAVVLADLNSKLDKLVDEFEKL